MEIDACKVVIDPFILVSTFMVFSSLENAPFCLPMATSKLGNLKQG